MLTFLYHAFTCIEVELIRQTELAHQLMTNFVKLISLMVNVKQLLQLIPFH